MASIFRIMTAAVGLGCGVIPSAMAVLIDPSTLHVGSGQGTSCVKGGCPVFGTELNLLGAGVFDIYQTSGGQSTALTSPLLAIVMVPNDLTGSLSSTVFSSAAYFSTPSTSSSSGGTAVTVSVAPSSYSLNYTKASNGFVGDMKTGDIYSFLGTAASSSSTFQNLFDSANNSTNMTNLTAGDLAVSGVKATNYGVYVYGLNTTGTGFGPNNVIDVSYSGLPAGSYVVGFGYQGSPSTSPNPFDTPFTETGIAKSGTTTTTGGGQTSVPEPVSLSIFGAALVALGVARRGRQR